MESIIINYNDFSSPVIHNKQTQTETYPDIQPDDVIDSLSLEIESVLQKNHDDDGFYYDLVEFGYIEIDGIPVSIRIFSITIDDDNDDTIKYMYTIGVEFLKYDISGYHEDDDEAVDEVFLFTSNHFENVKTTLRNLETVIRTYTFVDFFLLSPIEKKSVFLQRAFLFSFSKQYCCVCKNPTIEYTTCKHPICFHCRYDFLSINNNMCPVCKDGKLHIYPHLFKKMIDDRYDNMI
jgi:hypothetical protein